MSDQYSRPYSKNYSGLISQTVIGACIALVAAIAHGVLSRMRRGKHKNRQDTLGSRESWEFGYLFQGRSWAKNPSPPLSAGWPLSWVKQAIDLPEERLRQLRGIDATLYIRFLRGCFWFTLLQTFTTFIVLFPIHVEFSDDNQSPKSMTRALISSLVTTSRGRALLWVHICMLFWLTLSWIMTLVWICYGAFRMRARQIEDITKRVEGRTGQETSVPQHHTHPHPQYNFRDVPNLCQDDSVHGLRLRSVMVSNVPHQLRSEKELQQYFEYFMSRPMDKPSVGLPSSTQPGLLNKFFAFMFNRAKRIPAHLLTARPAEGPAVGRKQPESDDAKSENIPVIERVVVARKMTALASLLGRREEMLRILETAHIKLAQNALLAVKVEIARRRRVKAAAPSSSASPGNEDLEQGNQRDVAADADRMNSLIEALAPFIDEFGLQQPVETRRRDASGFKYAFRKLRTASEGDNDIDAEGTQPIYPPSNSPCKTSQYNTIWDALLSLDRATLDPYQPLIRLSQFFRGQTVPAIDYYTVKLEYLTSLITEQRAKSPTDFDPVSTAFVTFADPRDAKKACKYLAVHPNNPLACLVTMAPYYDDIDWIRVMRSNFGVEFLKDWVVNLGVWTFTVLWLFFVTLLVGLVSIEKISTFFPKLKSYLDRHAWGQEFIQSVLPTLLVALLALLIPPILLLIAKKAHTITTLSALHDLIMTRYYKFLIVNVLIFFCVGTAAMQSFLGSLRSSSRILNVVALSFPTAGPFYVGWLIFTVAMHGGFELTLFGLPMIMYPSTRRQITPRKRAVGIRPRTFNYYYWIPTHLLVLHTTLLFSLLNPLVIPFVCFYYFVEVGIIKNQLIHVYAKNYEGNGQIILIRIVRYSLDGLMLAQAVFLGYMVVLQQNINVALSAFLILFTAVVKICITRVCRAQFESQDITEGQVTCDSNQESGTPESEPPGVRETEGNRDLTDSALLTFARTHPSILTWRLPDWVNFTYSSVRQRIHSPPRRPPIPFSIHPTSSHLDTVILDHNPSRTDQGDASAVAQMTSQSLNNGPASPVTVRQLFSVEEQPRDSQERHRNQEPESLVSRHPPIVPWDDQPEADLPYDNPYYTRAISNVLWLPRDPFGILDLDDTIDMRISLTSDRNAEQIGTRPGAGDPSRQEIVSIPSRDTDTAGPQRHYTGSEEIALPEAIAKRVQHENDIEYADGRQPSLFSRRSSGSLSLEMRGIRHSPSIRSLPSLFRSTPMSVETQRRPATGVRPGRSMSESLKISRPRDLHPRSPVLPTIQLPETDDFLTPHPTLARTLTVTTQEAVAREVVAEEEARNQQTENVAQSSSQSWFTSWLFAKA